MPQALGPPAAGQGQQGRQQQDRVAAVEAASEGGQLAGMVQQAGLEQGRHSGQHAAAGHAAGRFEARLAEAGPAEAGGDASVHVAGGHAQRGAGVSPVALGATGRDRSRVLRSGPGLDQAGLDVQAQGFGIDSKAAGCGAHGEAPGEQAAGSLGGLDGDGSPASGLTGFVEDGFAVQTLGLDDAVDGDRGQAEGVGELFLGGELLAGESRDAATAGRAVFGGMAVKRRLVQEVRGALVARQHAERGGDGDDLGGQLGGITGIHGTYHITFGNGEPGNHWNGLEKSLYVLNVQCATRTSSVPTLLTRGGSLCLFLISLCSVNSKHAQKPRKAPNRYMFIGGESSPLFTRLFDLLSAFENLEAFLYHTTFKPN